MAQTYDAIASYTFGSAASSYTFSSIAASWTDLILVCSANGNRASNADSLAIRFNSDSGTNYSYTYLLGDYTNTASSGRNTNQTNIFVGNFTSNSVSNNFSSHIIQIMNYNNSTTYKSVIARAGTIAGGGYDGLFAIAGLWRSTSAITSILVRSETGNN